MALQSPMIIVVMIAKNEEAGIGDTLGSFGRFSDGAIILDTGSSDGTIERARALGAEVYQEPFVDFATTRNRVVEIATERYGTDAWLVMASGDDVAASDPDVVRAFIASPPGGASAALVERREGNVSYAQTMFFRSGSGWRYHGVTHEVITGPNGEVGRARVPGLVVCKRRGSWDRDAKRKRWEIDRDLLIEQLVKSPSDARARFYLAQTYECLGDDARAIDEYRKRIDLGGWHEEIYEANLRIARLLAARGGPLRDVVDAAVRAVEAFPGGRAEPLRLIARYVGQVADRTPYPTDALLFVDRDAYVSAR